MKQRDSEALAVYRTALAAVENAEAVTAGVEHSAGAIERSPVGVGSAEVARRELTEQDVAEIVRREVAERQATAESLRVSNPDAAARLTRGATLLETLLSSHLP